MMTKPEAGKAGWVPQERRHRVFTDEEVAHAVKFIMDVMPEAFELQRTLELSPTFLSYERREEHYASIYRAFKRAGLSANMVEGTILLLGVRAAAHSSAGTKNNT